jgi:hypothetical protein
VADELHRHPRVAVERLFEREDDDDLGDVALHRADAPRAPCPELRADVVGHRDTEPLHRRHQPEVHVGEINRDEHVGLEAARGLGELPDEREGSGDDAQRLREPGGRQAPVVREQLPTRLSEAITAEAGDLDPRLSRLQLAHERAGIQIARRLAARHQNAHGG